MQKRRATFRRSILRVHTTEGTRRLKDTVVAEEPLTLLWQASDGEGDRLLSTMRTPGDDPALAAGMLFSEGVVVHKGEIRSLSFCAGGGVNELNRLKAELRIPASVVRERLARRPSSGLPQSACGLCAMDDLSDPESLLRWGGSRYRGAGTTPAAGLLARALELLARECPLFSLTGASHAALLVGDQGALLSVAEDVGRHNACDKAIGRLLLEGGEEPFLLPPRTGLLVSSRLSFELAHKGLAAGVAWLASVGAPTHLALELASSRGVPVVGFLSEDRFNLYS